MVADVVAELKIVHGDRFVVVSDHSIEFSGDASGLRRILENLCNNAIKYGFPDTPVKIFLEEGQSDISIKVHNCGPVIPAEDQNNIFQQYHRTIEAKTGHREGWGIGLTLVRGVAEAHGGTVEVESSMGKGTIFIVKLPKNAHLLN